MEITSIYVPGFIRVANVNGWGFIEGLFSLQCVTYDMQLWTFLLKWFLPTKESRQCLAKMGSPAMLDPSF